MKPIEIARRIVETKTCHLFRKVEGSDSWPEGPVYLAVPFTEKVDLRKWVAWDLFSASVVIQVHDALGEKNRAKLAAMEPLAMVDVACRLVSQMGKIPA